MAGTLYPKPTTSPVSASSYTVPLAQTFYSVSGKTFDSGLYTITTFPTSSQATITFADTSNTVAVTTVSGTATASLAFTPTLTTFWVDTGTSTLVTLNRTAAALSAGGLSGTLDTITTSGTYNQTGKLYVVAIAGGWGGGRGGSGPAIPMTADEYAGGLGGLGGTWASYGPAYVNSAQTVTVGAGGNGQAGSNTSNTGAGYGNQGGISSFGNLAIADNANSSFNRALGGNPNGTGANITTSSVLYKDISNGTNGGGGQGAGTYNGAGNGVGSGIGTGGNGSSNTNLPGNAATGYGAGGGGGKNNGARFNGTGGGAGSQGVVYVLRGF